ncbi:MAG: hypothetical protein JNL79_06890 [Myxococcales bacterium]|nr:hypothetical protein [Myxococcales bacterium]
MSDALRSELDALPKEDLVRRAEAQGIEGARKLTRLELVDELVRLGGGSRGLLGKARDLLRDAVEVGLSRVLAAATQAGPADDDPPPSHGEPAVAAAPTAAATAAPTPVEQAEAAQTEEPIATVTLAKVFLSQGHAGRAREIVDSILRREPDHRAALEFRAELETRDERARSVPPPPPPPPLEADFVDECVALVVDDTAVHVAWDVHASTLARARRAFRDVEPALVLRVLVFEPSVQGPKVASHDVPIEELSGDHFARELPPFSVVRAAIGLVAGERFVPIAHTADVVSDPKASSTDGDPAVVVWTDAGTFPVAPGGLLQAEAAAYRELLGASGTDLEPEGGREGDLGDPLGNPAEPRRLSPQRGWPTSPARPTGHPGGPRAGRPTSPISLADRRSGSRV